MSQWILWTYTVLYTLNEIHMHVHNTFPWASTGAPFCKSSLATLMLPYLAARWSGVKPFCNRKFSIKYRKTTDNINYKIDF